MSETRAVSEVMGFILVFSLVLAAIGIVYTSGLPALGDTRDVERVNNAERAFDVLATNFQQMGRGEAPNRATEIKLSEAQLETTDNQRIRVNSTELSTAVRANPVAIRYRSGTGSEIFYEKGAVIRVDDGGARMLREPDFLFDDDRVVIRYIATRGSGQSVGGTTTALVRAERRTADVLAAESPATDVEIELETDPDRADVWVDYLEGEIESVTGSPGNCDVTESGSTATVSCDPFDVDSLTVARVRVRVTLT